MPIIAKIGRKHIRVRALILSLYVVLLLGAVTMVYPFLLMLSGSAKSMIDENEFSIIPGFLKNDEKLYQKHIEALFNERLDVLRATYDLDVNGFDKLRPPSVVNTNRVAAWHDFIQRPNRPDYYDSLGHLFAPLSRTFPLCLRAFKKEMMRRYNRSITRMNIAMDTEFVNWNAYVVSPEYYLPRRNAFLTGRWHQALRAFKQRQASWLRYTFNIEGFYKHHFLKPLYTRDIKAYNAVHGTDYRFYDRIRLSRYLPRGSATEREDWENFVRGMLHLLWIRVDEKSVGSYQEYLRAKYGDIAVLNRNYETRYRSFAAVPLVRKLPDQGLVLSDWDAFIKGWIDPTTQQRHQPAAEHLSIHSPGHQFRDHLRSVYGSIGRLNAEWKTAYTQFSDIRMPQREAHYLGFLKHRRLIRDEFIKRNYITVIDYLILHGRGLLNTAIYCILAILAALIVNPMAAYALSRYRLPKNYKLLLFMLLTMAFPPMVTQIPLFLMLRDLKMLNTFAALVLPGMAHGYSIFLLKGFFDSLPRDLYESAQMDGANEWVMFWNIPMSLSKPILAVIALNAFTTAYSNFMFALLICQSEKMWTLMVWLFQLQQRSGLGVVYASLIVAALPTFMVFLFCQNIIMRGIVVPVEK